MKKNTQEVREYAKNDSEKIDAMNIEEIKTGLKQKSEEFKAQGSKIYKGV